MEKVVKIGNKEMGLKATALTPRLYRFKIGRDMIVDLNNLKKSYEKALKSKNKESEEDVQLSVTDLTIFENIAFIMARQYNTSLPNTVDEWLDSQDEVFTVYELLPHILELWQLNEKTTSVPVKK